MATIFQLTLPPTDTQAELVADAKIGNQPPMRFAVEHQVKVTPETVKPNCFGVRNNKARVWASTDFVCFGKPERFVEALNPDPAQQCQPVTRAGGLEYKPSAKQ